MAIKYLNQLHLDGKKVLIRVDYNVPYDKSMNITDDTRISETLPTIKYCTDRNAKVVLISHLGRPKGKRVPEMSLAPAAKRLSELLKKDVKFIEDPIGDEVMKKIDAMKAGEVALLENIRFYPEEEKNDDAFGKLLAGLGEVYIDDAFAAAHRGHASNDAITKHIGEVAAGFLLEKEIEYFNKALLEPERPLAVVIGGAKVSTKIEVLENIIQKVDSLIIGGGMAFTFLKAKGLGVGRSLLEADFVDTAKAIMEKAEKAGVKILLPVDVVAAPEFKDDAPQKVVPVDKMPDDMMGLDIGPESIKLFNEAILKAKTVVWNGPMGAFEMPSYAKGTREVGFAIGTAGRMSIVGGGDSVTAVNQLNLAEKITYISTGGGAFLELLEGKKLPAIAALDR
ncbi:MAG TPA: phosphoglycerate kinase [Spirochaetota bacterium]|nr:phosphoglycerate kinase [Spirochaetota bacterium]